MRLLEEQIIVDSYNDFTICARAILAVNGAAAMMDKEALFDDELDENLTHVAVQGLSKISRGDLGPDFHGITPAHAEYILGDLFPTTTLDGVMNIAT